MTITCPLADPLGGMAESVASEPARVALAVRRHEHGVWEPACLVIQGRSSRLCRPDSDEDLAGWEGGLVLTDATVDLGSSPFELVITSPSQSLRVWVSSPRARDAVVAAVGVQGCVVEDALAKSLASDIDPVKAAVATPCGRMNAKGEWKDKAVRVVGGKLQVCADLATTEALFSVSAAWFRIEPLGAEGDDALVGVCLQPVKFAHDGSSRPSRPEKLRVDKAEALLPLTASLLAAGASMSEDFASWLKSRLAVGETAMVASPRSTPSRELVTKAADDSMHAAASEKSDPSAAAAAVASILAQLEDARSVAAELAIRAAAAEGRVAEWATRCGHAEKDRDDAAAAAASALAELDAVKQHEAESLQELVSAAMKLTEENQGLQKQLEDATFAQGTSEALDKVRADLDTAKSTIKSMTDTHAAELKSLKDAHSSQVSVLEGKLAKLEASTKAERAEVVETLSAALEENDRLKKLSRGSKRNVLADQERVALLEKSLEAAVKERDAARQELDVAALALRGCQEHLVGSRAEAEDLEARLKAAYLNADSLRKALDARKHLEGELRSRAATAEYEAEAAAASAEGAHSALRGLRSRLSIAEKSELTAKQLANQLYAALEISGLPVSLAHASSPSMGQVARLKGGPLDMPLIMDGSEHSSPAKSVRFITDGPLTPTHDDSDAERGSPADLPSSVTELLDELVIEDSASLVAARRVVARARAAITSAFTRQDSAERRASELEATVSVLSDKLSTTQKHLVGTRAKAEDLQSALDELRWKAVVEGRFAGFATPSNGSASNGGPTMAGPHAARSSPSQVSRLDVLQKPEFTAALSFKEAILGRSLKE
jgi:hypothetical protein